MFHDVKFAVVASVNDGAHAAFIPSQAVISLQGKNRARPNPAHADHLYEAMFRIRPQSAADHNNSQSGFSLIG